MANGFRKFYIDHVPRQQNAYTDALASLAASLALPTGVVEKNTCLQARLVLPKNRF